MRRRASARPAALVAGLLLGMVACSSGAVPSPAPPLPSTVTDPTPLAPPSATPVPTAVPATSAAPTAPDPVAFFRSLQAGCRAHARATANPEVAPDRFSNAKRVRDLGGGATLIEDGRGTRLLVEPARGIVLPPSGKVSDAMPTPYSFGCSEKVFQGANAD